jgi:hypothetical protein
MNKHYLKQVRYLKYLSVCLKNLMNSTKEGAREEAERLAEKIALLLNKLKLSISGKELRKALGGVAVFFGLATGTAYAQQFAPPVTNPFSLTSADDIAVPTFVDIDGDGDLDLFVGDFNNIRFYQNVGTVSEPQFASPSTDVFGIELQPETIIGLLAFVDLDNDGDYDLIMGEVRGSYYSMEPGRIFYYENIGSASSPAFAAPVINPFNISTANFSNLSAPTLADLDGDGDYDLIVGTHVYSGYYEGIYYFENIGTSSAPNFANPVANPFGIEMPENIALPVLADVDDDGDYDLFLIDEVYLGAYDWDSPLKYYQNVGTPQSPSFLSPVINPFGIEVSDDDIHMAFGDLDNDGDLDLIIGEYYGNMRYYENTMYTVGTNDMETIQVEVFPNPTSDVVYLNSSSEIIKQVEVVDVTGRSILSQAYDGNSINLSKFPTGTYFLKITNNEGKSTIKQIVKK